MTEEGYAATVLTEGAYSLSVELPVEDLALRSTNEIVAFDFTDYNNAEAVRDNTPEVRALVREVAIDRDRPGMMILFR